MKTQLGRFTCERPHLAANGRMPRITVCRAPLYIQSFARIEVRVTRLPILTISSPQPNAVVGNAPFTVAGSVAVPWMPEPAIIESVTVRIDSQPAAHATLKHTSIAGNQSMQVAFSATVKIIDTTRDTHTVTVTVASYVGIPIKWHHMLVSARKVVRTTLAVA